MPHLRDQLQQSIGGSYSIERELGGGGMSRVFVATETALGRTVVVKVLPQELAGGLSASRFDREIQVAARLQHPNIVPVLSAGEADGIPYYTMPFVDGESLRAKLAREGELPVRQAASILRDVARALEYAHGQGVVHRDIKPDNVLLASDYAVVTDFGVAKALLAAQSHGAREAGATSLTQLGVAIGTPAYMSPEQAAGDTVDSRADIYAFGCTAYEILTGHAPFTGGSAQALMAAHATRTPVPLATERPAVPPALAALVMRCMEKRASDRPQTAREIVDALDAMGTPTTGGIPSVMAPVHRNKSRLAIGVAAAVVVAVGVVYFATRAPALSVRDNVVTVTPFRVAGADASLHILREGMLDLVSAKLSGTMTAVDPRTTLAAWRRRGGGESTDLAEGDALALAAQLRAGRLLQGEIVGTPQRMVISATLLGVPGGRTRATASVTGAQEQLPVLVDSLAAQLFALEAGRTAQEARQLAGTPWTALQQYLIGQSLYRRGKYVDAMGAFSRALDADSTFALAGIALSVTSAWTGLDPQARGLTLALRHYDQLGARERVLLDGRDPRWLAGSEPSCADREASAERNVAAFPDMPEAWYFLGDHLFHCGWVTTQGDDPWVRATTAFQRALAIDSTFSPAHEHLPHLYSYAGDTTRALAELDRAGQDSTDYANLWRFMLGLFRDSVARRRWIDRRASGEGIVPGMLPNASLVTPYHADGERVMQGLLRSTATRHEQVTVAEEERHYALERGEPLRAAAAGRRANLPPWAALLAAVFWDGDSLEAERALPAATLALRGRPARDTWYNWTDNVYAVAQYGLAHGDTSRVQPAIALLRAPAQSGEESWLSDRRRQLALLLDVQLAARDRRADAGALLVRADSMNQSGPPNILVANASTLIVTRLWEQSGNLTRAYAASKRVQSISGQSFVSTSYLARARIAATLGERADAMLWYRRYLSMRYDPEPSLRPQVEAVRKELARLESATR